MNQISIEQLREHIPGLIDNLSASDIEDLNGVVRHYTGNNNTGSSILRSILPLEVTAILGGGSLRLFKPIKK